MLPTGLGVVLALLGVAVGGVYLQLPSAQERAVRHLPTPPGGMLIVTLKLMWKHGARVYDWILDHNRLYNGRPWRMQLLGRPVTVIFSSVDVVEDILKTQFEVFAKGEFTSRAAFDILGKGIFVADGELWSHQRKTASHLFSLQMLRDSMEAAVREYCEILCERLDAVVACDENVVEIKRLLDLFTMDVFTKIGFGVDVGGLRGCDNQPFLDAFERSSLALLYRFQQPMWLWQLKKTLSIGVEKQLKKDMAVINDTINGIISRSIHERQSGNITREDRRDLIGLFLDKPPPASLTSTTGGGGMDPVLIRDMAMNFIAAGRDTTSQSMAWFLIMMNRHPQILERVRAELHSKLPSLQTAKAIPTMHEVQDLVYLEAAIRESLRLNPVVAVTSRTAMQDTTLVDGTFLKAGTRAVFSSYAMARMESVWGDDAECFNPDRWIDAATGRLVSVSPYKYPVFLGGPRMCLGVKFALMEMKITMAVLLSRYDLCSVRDPFAFTYRASATMGIRGPLDVRVTARVDPGRSSSIT